MDNLITLPQQAQLALSRSDKTILRCIENGLAVPPEWSRYRAALRAVVAGTSPGPLPQPPAYPAGS